MNQPLPTTIQLESGEPFKCLNVQRGSEEAAALLLARSGYAVHSLKKFTDEYLTRPERKRGTAMLSTLESFIDHAKRHADMSSVIFAGTGPAPSLMSMLDYHEENGAPRFGEHRGVYHFPFSDEWKAWSAHNKEGMSQSGFAEFLETRLVDVIDPAKAKESTLSDLGELKWTFADPAKMLELSHGLDARVEMQVANRSNLSSGETEFVFKTENKDSAGKTLRVPQAFFIQIPFFEDGEIYQIAVRLRYRIQEQTLRWWYELHGTERRIRHAVQQAAKHAAEQTKLPLYYGSPE